MSEQITTLRQEFAARLDAVTSIAELEEIRVEYLGKKGSVTALLKSMKDLSGEEKKAFGQESMSSRTKSPKPLQRKPKPSNRRSWSVKFRQCRNSMLLHRPSSTEVPITRSHSYSVSVRRYSSPWALQLRTTPRS